MMPSKVKTRNRPSTAERAVVRPLATGKRLRDSHRRLRETVDQPNLALFGGALLVPPPDAEGTGFGRFLDARELDRWPAVQLLEFLRSISPEISRAIWDFLRMMNPGYEWHCYRPGTETEDTRAEELIGAFLDTLKGYYGSFDVVVNRLNLAAFLRGAYLAELVLDNRGRMPIDLATPDPRWFFFDLVLDPVRGQIYKLVQWQATGTKVTFDQPTVRYVPVDPMPGKPYGEGLAWPALNTTVFLIGMLHDLRRVVQQQGWPRIDITVDLDRLKASMPPEDQADPARVQAWLDDAYATVKGIYDNLEPDEAYLHSQSITVNRPAGTVDANSLGAVDGLIGMLERMQVRALKTMPLLFGINEASSETHANRQWEVHVAGVKALQHLLENLLEHLFAIALRVQGIQATVKFEFAELRAAELLRDAQIEKLQITNEALKYALGLKTLDEVAQAITGNDTAVAPEPLVPLATILGGGGSGGGSQNPSTVTPEPGSNRSISEERKDCLPAIMSNGNGAK